MNPHMRLQLELIGWLDTAAGIDLVNRDLLLFVTQRVGLPSVVWGRNHRSVSPVEKGRKASLFFSAPLASRKCSGLKVS